MAIDADQIIEIRKEVGDQPSDSDLNDMYTRLGDVDAIITEILEIRLANLIRTPATFAVPGEYSQSTAANIEALKDKLAARGAGDSSLLDFIPAPDPRVR